NWIELPWRAVYPLTTVQPPARESIVRRLASCSGASTSPTATATWRALGASRGARRSATGIMPEETEVPGRARVFAGTSPFRDSQGDPARSCAGECPGGGTGDPRLSAGAERPPAVRRAPAAGADPLLPRCRGRRPGGGGPHHPVRHPGAAERTASTPPPARRRGDGPGGPPGKAVAHRRRVRGDRARPGRGRAGVWGRTAQALAEAELARASGYHAALLSLAALQGATERELLALCRAVAGVVPVVGFYLQPAVGGRVLPFSFWRQLAEIDNL